MTQGTLKYRIGIGVHTAENVPSAVYFNHCGEVMSWARELADVEFAFFGTARVKVADARIVITRQAVAAGCTHWLSLDADHLFAAHALPMLWENKDAAAVSGLITKRYYPFESVAFKFLKGADGQELLQTLALAPGMGVVEVDACAFGCTLFNLEWMKRLPQPWFYDDRSGRSDMNLCKALRRIGGSVKVDTRVCVGHLQDPVAVWPQTADALRAQEVARAAACGT